MIDDCSIQVQTSKQVGKHTHTVGNEKSIEFPIKLFISFHTFFHTFFHFTNEKQSKEKSMKRKNDNNRTEPKKV